MASIEQEKKMYRAELQAVSSGYREAHVWTSPLFPGAEISTSFVWPGESVKPTDHKESAAFAAQIALQYSGQMTPERAIEKLVALDLALGIVDQHEL
jgi:hypothetical protein